MDPKERFDAWASLRDHAWREFQEKSSAEWKLSFSVWAAVLASASLLATEKAAPALLKLLKVVHECWIAAALIAVVLVHLVFLLWIEKRMIDIRGDLDRANDAMNDLMESAKKKSKKKQRVFLKPSMWVQFAITSLLATVLGFILVAAKG